MSGFEERTGGVGSIKATAGKDRRDFAEFYTEFEAEKGFIGMGKSFAKTGLFYEHSLSRLQQSYGRSQDLSQRKPAFAPVAAGHSARRSVATSRLVRSAVPGIPLL